MKKKEDSEPLITKPLALVVALVLWLLFAPLGKVGAEELYPIPETIKVRITEKTECEDEGIGPLEVIDFKEYVKGVLPNEWYPTWNEEALKAGAVAVKMYGWSMYETYGFVYDCNWNQVYNPANRTDATDKAVDDTWNWVLMKSRNVTKSVTKDDLIRTYYDDFPSACNTRGHECMPQWGTLIDANNGMVWQDIVLKYYQDSWLYCQPSWLRRGFTR